LRIKLEVYTGRYTQYLSRRKGKGRLHPHFAAKRGQTPPRKRERGKGKILPLKRGKRGGKRGECLFTWGRELVLYATYMKRKEIGTTYFYFFGKRGGRESVIYGF